MKTHYTHTKKWYRKIFLRNFLVPFFLFFNEEGICVYILFVGMCYLPPPTQERGKIIIKKFRKIIIIPLNPYESNAVYIATKLRKKTFF